MMKKFERLINGYAQQKKLKGDFFMRMGNYRISHLKFQGWFFNCAMGVCALISFMVLSIGGTRQNFSAAIVNTIIVFTILALIFMICYVVAIFVKNSYLFKLGKIKWFYKFCYSYHSNYSHIAFVLYIHTAGERSNYSAFFVNSSNFSGNFDNYGSALYSCTTKKREDR